MDEKKITFTQKLILAIISVFVPGIFALFIHYDNKKIIPKDLKQEISSEKIIEPVNQIKQNETERIPEIKKTTINNSGTIGTVISGDVKEITINNTFNSNEKNTNE